jgi:hypothetical protein
MEKTTRRTRWRGCGLETGVREGETTGEKLRAGRCNSDEEFWPPGEAIDRDRARARSSGGGGALWSKVEELDGVGMAGHRAGAASKRERRVRGRELPLSCGSHLSGRAGARPDWVGWAALLFSFFLNFLIAFPFLFPRVFNSNSIQVSFKLIQTCATIQRIFKLSMMQHFMTHNVLAKINN